MEWAGDVITPGVQSATPSVPKSEPDKNAAATAPVHYDDGFGPMPSAPTPAAGSKPEQQPQTKSLADDVGDTEDSFHGIGGPIPDSGDAMAQSLDAGVSPEYPQASRFDPAASVNYRTVSGPRTINRIVIHITDGGAKIDGPVGWFKNPNQRDVKGNPIHVSAHYVIGQNGEVVQMVKHNDVAWHASSANGDSIGIEHVANTRGLKPTADEYCASAALVNWLCGQFNVAMDRSHILGHNEASPRDHHVGCPDAAWDWDYYMGLLTSASCEDPATAAASSLALGGAPRGASMPRATALRQVDAGYAPSDQQEALRYMQEFQNRKQAWKAGVPDTTFFPHSAICRFRIFQPDDEYIGTGFYIGQDRILTCAHNVAKATSLTIIPGKNAAAEPFGSFTVQPSDWVIHKNFDYDTMDTSPTGHDFDLAVIKVKVPPPAGQAFTNLEELLQCQDSPIIVCGYGSHPSEGVDPNKQHLDGDAIRLLNDSGETVLYNLQTEGGNSGSPVYYVTVREDEERQQSVLETRVIGVHVSSDSKILNQGCRLTADKIAWINSVSFPISSGASALSVTEKKHRHAASAPAVGAAFTSARSMDAPAIQPASTTSGIGVADNARPYLACIHGLTEQGRGITFVQRYLRNLTVPEVTALSLAGLQIVSCYEENQPDPPVTHFTQAQGQHDGRRAFTQAQALDQPAGTPIYFAIDTDPDTRQRQVILDYVQGIREGCAQYLADMQARGLDGPVYDIGIYGSACVLEWCRDQGIATWFWQARAPGWCNNRQPWPGANLRTWRLDSPATCGASLDHLEGWGNEGAWTLTVVAQQQSLSPQLPAPPPRKRYARGQAADGSPRLIGTSPVNTITGGDGNVTWELDQFPGVKMASQTAVAPLQSAERIELSNWPYCDHTNGSRAAAWFNVDWKFSGQSLGQVRITPAGTQQGPKPLRVEARIEDGASRDPNLASLVVRFTYHFATASAPDVVATTELKLYSDGSIDQNSNWMSQVAA